MNGYVIEFWDFGKWDEMSHAAAPWRHKAEAVAIAQQLNRSEAKGARGGAPQFEGHRYRVRARREARGKG